MEFELLSEGGAAGHMNHLYDNGELTFAKLKEIFSAAAEGKLEGTEKTDGQNLMISYSVKEGRAKGVRNKTEIKGGGLTPEQLADKFADRANPALKDTFKDALKAFERAIHGLDHKTQIELFGENTNIYYNAEVMDPRTPNVINYDTKTLVIHRAGHADFDRETGQRRNTDLSAQAAKLEDIISQAQEKIKSEEYGVQVNAVRKLKALSDKKPLNTAVSKLNSILSSVNYLIGKSGLSLDDNSTVDEFMMARVYTIINSILDKALTEIGKVDSVAKMNITKRVLGVKGISINDIAKKLTPEQKVYVKENVLNQSTISEILKLAINPLEMVVSDFATEMLRGLESAFILDNSKEIRRLRGEVNSAISAIQGSGREDAMSILNSQLKKLKSADNVSATAEGFVFDYDGVTYKFTGNFAPVNQILGLFKYGRGKVPPIKKEALQEAKKAKETIALVPGAFKPPHRGHMHMIEQYSKIADRVIVLISALARPLPDGRGVTAARSKQIFELYIKKMNLSNVDVIISQDATPVQSTINFVSNVDNNPDYAQPGQTIILGASTKGDDHTRFDSNLKVRKGVNVIKKPVKPYKDMSATHLRKYIADGDVDKLTEFMPDDDKKLALQVIKMFEGEGPVDISTLSKANQKKLSKTTVNESTIYDIILEHFKNKYKVKKKKYFKNIKEMSTAGAVAGFPANAKEENNERSRED